MTSRTRKSRIERNGSEITLNADDELKLKQMHELLQGHLARRKIDAGVIDYKPLERLPDRRCGRMR
jgi:uncharacterized protein YajQ (UPF0234 family)